MCICTLAMAVWLGGCTLFKAPSAGYERRSRAVYRTGVYHTVKRGQTLWRICLKYHADVEQVAVLNGIDDPDQLEAGSKIFIPGAKRRQFVSVSPDSGASLRQKRHQWASYFKKSKKREVAKRANSRELASGGPLFIWPVRGKVVRKFGLQDGVKYQGISISAPERATIRAAAGGQVIFSDWGPRIFGRTIIIRHADGAYYSIYSHNAVNLVQKGQTVRRGSPIARVGRTGNVESAQLHFEIRDRTKPRDPLIYLP